MTWVMENKTSNPENRVAVVNLKVCAQQSQHKKIGSSIPDIILKSVLDTCVSLEKLLPFG